MEWTPSAESRLKEVPFFVRPVVRRKIEGLAVEAGKSEVDEGFYESAKAQFGQK
ncbi:PCP reductase family protein [Cyanobium sp. HWJ4-Hawea]|uniref:PCP reductase family protein n=1 Tax=Cyanobium sp. HWJ4-Hawea TaxID=2823713 RepID=UPI0020CE1742|nr:PCP reductase family protein [Cyanobium sp. HWJ4-Hawea]MCP9808911.1 PCP reductase family protein [Cyanobium sp. HWJ4-Hawea]